MEVRSACVLTFKVSATPVDSLPEIQGHTKDFAEHLEPGVTGTLWVLWLRGQTEEPWFFVFVFMLHVRLSPSSDSKDKGAFPLGSSPALTEEENKARGPGIPKPVY